ncbi:MULTISPECIES: hypothetical protein [Rhodopseudomonas]|uniref:hypothetical protein n=1 Tax=Rhodopseudomonas TaxID=1073 RepID=UPI000A65EE98|nr:MULTISPECIES: hypothetical protein [Rhodopseudomonas]MDF3813199.1 hypothetical protein [Rhodopseudomonas sp. BAL398]WOK17817.1 hypothetical protein RBJ75_27505 [Rhodopseudomonas sp. BAL398]
MPKLDLHHRRRLAEQAALRGSEEMDALERDKLIEKERIAQIERAERWRDSTLRPPD